MLLLDEPFSGLDRPSAERPRRADRGARRRGPAVVIATHDLEQARRWDSVLCVNRRQIADRPPRRADSRPRACSKPPTAARSSRSPAAAAARSCPHTTTTTDARAPARTVHAAGPRRDRPARRSPAARSAAGSSSTSSPTRPSRSPTRSSPGSCSPRSPASRCCSAAAPAIVLAALAIALVARVAGVSRDVGVAVVVTTMFGARRPAGALARLAAGNRDAALRRHPRRPRDADLVAAAVARRGARRGAAPCCTAGCWRPASTAARRARSALSPALRRRGAAGPARRPAIVVAVQGLGNLLVVAVFVGPAAAAPQLTDRIVPMIAARRRRSRCSPASPVSTSPITRAPPAAPRSRWRSSPPTCSRCRPALRALHRRRCPAPRRATIG